MINIDLIEIPGGEFWMGSLEDEDYRSHYESPQHLVTIRPFFMGRYPVTQAQWMAVAALPKINLNINSVPSYFKAGNRPVEKVSWYEAFEFCDRLSRKTGKQYRLPTEAEWEYACRAGTTTPFHFGETITPEDANCFNYRQKTAEVGSFSPNTFGLYDMHGNVWEWCADHWHDSYEGAPTDGSAWSRGGDQNCRIVRGGSWINNPWLCRSASRVYNPPVSRSNAVGFRVVCE